MSDSQPQFREIRRDEAEKPRFATVTNEQIYLSAGAYQMAFGDREVTHFRYEVSEPSGQIAIVPTDENDPNGYVVNRHSESSGAVASASRALRAVGIPWATFEGSERVDVSVDAQNGRIIVDVSNLRDRLSAEAAADA